MWDKVYLFFFFWSISLSNLWEIGVTTVSVLSLFVHFKEKPLGRVVIVLNEVREAEGERDMEMKEQQSKGGRKEV